MIKTTTLIKIKSFFAKFDEGFLRGIVSGLIVGVIVAFVYVGFSLTIPVGM